MRLNGSIPATPGLLGGNNGYERSICTTWPTGALFHFGTSQRRSSTGDAAMTVYLIADIKVTDNGWVPEYAASVHHIVHTGGHNTLSAERMIRSARRLVSPLLDFLVV